MIESGMFVGLGFLLGLLLALFLAPPLWRRAVRLTKRRIEATLPMSVSDIQADKDHLRAQFAVQLRRAEMSLEKAKEKSARMLVEANKHRVAYANLDRDAKEKTATLGELQNANRVLEQTIRKRLPELEGLLREARSTIDRQDERMSQVSSAHAAESDALAAARNAARMQSEEIERLRLSLEGAAPMPKSRIASVTKPTPARASDETVQENQRLTAEVSRLREDIGELRGTAATETRDLRGELERLADQLLGAVTRAGEESVLELGPAAIAEPTTLLPALRSDQPAIAADELAAPATEVTDLMDRREKRRRSRRRIERRGSLAERLAGVEAEKA